MKTIAVLNMKGEEVSKRNLLENVFGITPNVGQMHMVVVNHLAQCRQGTQSTKTRAEVSGGGIKPWRQKGTGRARQGSIRAPHWIHGGIALGPKPRKYGFSINKKIKKNAMKSALSTKSLENCLVIVDSIKMDEFSTKKFIEFADNIKVKSKKALFVLSDAEKKVVKSASNVKEFKTAHISELNVYDLLKYDQLVLDVGALNRIEEVYG